VARPWPYRRLRPCRHPPPVWIICQHGFFEWERQSLPNRSRSCSTLLCEALSGPAAVETSPYQTHPENRHAESARWFPADFCYAGSHESDGAYSSQDVSVSSDPIAASRTKFRWSVRIFIRQDQQKQPSCVYCKLSRTCCSRIRT